MTCPCPPSLGAFKEYAKANGYSVARECMNEAESGRVADRPQFREMIEEGSKPKAPFEVILINSNRKLRHSWTVDLDPSPNT